MKDFLQVRAFVNQDHMVQDIEAEFREWHRLVLQQRVWNRHIHKYGLPELSLCSDIRDKRMKVEAQGEKERTNNFDKGPFTYSPNGSVRQSPDGKF